jgi:hypothetical protein
MLIALSLLLTAVKPVGAEEGDVTLRIYDISALSAPRFEHFGRSLGVPPADMSIPELPESEPSPFMEIDAVADLLRFMVEPESWDEEGAEVNARQGGLLFVSNRVHVLEKVEAALTAISHAADRRVRLEVTAFEGPEDAAPEAHESGAVEVFPGKATTFRVTNRARFLVDYNVQVAENAALVAPVVWAADEGFAIDLVAHPTIAGDRVVVEALTQIGRFERPVRKIQLADKDSYLLGSLDLPVLEHSDGFSTHIVKSGESFSLSFQENGTLRTVRVKATVLGRGGPGWIFDVGAMTRLQKLYLAGYHPDLDGDPESRRRSAPVMNRLEPQHGPMGYSEEILDLLTQNVDPWYWEEEGGINVFDSGGLVVKAKPEVLERVRRFLVAREAQALVPVGVNVEIRSVAGPVASGATKEKPEGAVFAAADLATVPGKDCCAILGRTRNFVASYEAQVAQSSKISDPIVGQTFDGVVVNLGPRLSMDRTTVRLEVGLLVAHRAPKADEPTDPEAQFVGKLNLVSEKRSVFQTTLTFPKDHLYVLDVGPDPKTPKRRLAAMALLVVTDPHGSLPPRASSADREPHWGSLPQQAAEAAEERPRCLRENTVHRLQTPVA